MIFSVVVPTHNRPESLQRLLASLAAQSIDVNQFEVILVPSPSDKSLPWLQEAAKTYPFQLHVHLPSDPYQGKSASFKRNEGAKQASTEWLAFIDDDCEADPLWLATAALHTHKHDLHGMEGLTEIPVPEKITFTFKGLQRLSEPGGYQTCNMFYRKTTFLEMGGFDLNFPFYLEDTDLAWTFIDHKKNIMFVDQAIVRHPVPPPEVKRLLHNAQRTRLIPYLYKKHPDLFEHSDLRPIGRAQWVYLILYVGTIYSVLMSPHKLHTFLLLFLVIVIFNVAYTARLMGGCSFEVDELLETFFYLPMTPVISFYQLMRGNLENKTFLVF